MCRGLRPSPERRVAHVHQATPRAPAVQYRSPPADRDQAAEQCGQLERTQRTAKPHRRGEPRDSGGNEGKRDADGKGDHGGIFSKTDADHNQRQDDTAAPWRVGNTATHTSVVKPLGRALLQSQQQRPQASGLRALLLWSETWVRSLDVSVRASQAASWRRAAQTPCRRCQAWRRQASRRLAGGLQSHRHGARNHHGERSRRREG